MEVSDWLVVTGTIAKGAALLHQEGAREVYACSTHAVFRYADDFYQFLLFDSSMYHILKREKERKDLTSRISFLPVRNITLLDE